MSIKHKWQTGIFICLFAIISVTRADEAILGTGKVKEIYFVYLAKNTNNCIDKKTSTRLLWSNIKNGRQIIESGCKEKCRAFATHSPWVIAFADKRGRIIDVWVTYQGTVVYKGNHQMRHGRFITASPNSFDEGWKFPNHPVESFLRGIKE